MMNLESMILLAEGETAAPAAQTAAPAATQGTEQVPADGKPQENGGAGGLLGNPMLLMIAIFVVMLFFMMRSQKKQQAKRQQMISQITKGSRVTTSSGMFGIVSEVKDESFVIEVAPNVNIEFAKAAVSGVNDAAAADKK